MKKYVIFVCMMFVIAGLSIISTGVETTNLDFSLKIDESDLDPSVINANGDPVVVITSPPEGADLPHNYIVVLGYAQDLDGLVFFEWTYQSSGGSYYYNSSTLPGYTSLTFQLGVNNIQPGSHTVTVTLYDSLNNSGSDSVTVTYGMNDNPEKPNRPEGPDSGSVGIEYTYSTHSVDPNDDDIRYGWDWDGDNVVDEWTGFYESGETAEASHTWDFERIYNVKVKAEDELGKQSLFSSPLAVHISDNSAPEKPETPSGSTIGRPGVSYSYETSSVDPQGDRIYYMFDWADGTELEWVGPFGSGDDVSFSHVWGAKGSYAVKVKAKDDPNDDGDLSDGMESVWSDPLAISMPKAKTFNFFDSLFSRIPILKNLFSFLF